MPQLDKVTFLSQFFWLTFFFIGFYFLILKYFLPKMSRILKFRKEQTGVEDSLILLNEGVAIRGLFEGYTLSGSHLAEFYLLETIDEVEDWIDDIQTSTNKNHYQIVNQDYLEGLAESSTEDTLAISQAAPSLSSDLLIHSLVAQIQETGLQLN